LNNLTWHNHKVDNVRRAKIKGQRPLIIWFTGLSGSGKSTIANDLEIALSEKKLHTYLLDGDNVRHGLNKDLGFSPEDRKENIRRIAEVSKLFLDSGIIVITAFISPFEEDRKMVRDLVGNENFIEVYAKCSLEECIRRDPKGLYEKAKQGEINNFTGLKQSYEVPSSPELVLDTENFSVKDCVNQVLHFLNKKGMKNKND